VYDQYKKPIIFPIHPRTLKRIGEMFPDDYLSSLPGVQCTDPMSYLDFLYLLAESRLVMTDSGGIQEEACVLHVPCVTLRANTERPETITAGSNKLAGTEPRDILDAVNLMFAKEELNWENPYGDGTAAAKIVDILVTAAEQS